MDDDTNYDDLSILELENIVLSNDVISIPSALHALHEKDPARALRAGEKLLLRDDPWCQAAALDVVFEEDQSSAIRYMAEQGRSCGAPVLRMMVELLATTEHAPNRDAVAEVLDIVWNRIREMQDGSGYDMRELFLGRYPELASSSSVRS